jgi:hypothetical protein
MAILCGEFIDDKLFQELLDVLEVGDIAAGADDSVFSGWVKPLNVLEASKGAI